MRTETPAAESDVRDEEEESSLLVLAASRAHSLLGVTVEEKPMTLFAETPLWLLVSFGDSVVGEK
jgi:hypothetical protein